jgi:hypothetical protein
MVKKEMTVGEGLITALKQAIDYERGEHVEGVKARTASTRRQPKPGSSGSVSRA